MKFPHLAPFLFGIGLLATSCATMPNHRLPEVPPSTASTAKKVSLTYSMTSGHEMSKGARQESLPAARQLFETPLVAAATQSGRFSSVNQGKGGSVHLDVDMLNYGDGVSAMVSGFISGFTFLAVPGFATDNYKLTATARNSSGKSRKYVLDDGVTTVFWLPLIVATPFSNPSTVVPKVQENMYRNLIQKMESDGLVPKAGN